MPAKGRRRILGRTSSTAEQTAGIAYGHGCGEPHETWGAMTPRLAVSWADVARPGCSRAGGHDPMQQRSKRLIKAGVVLAFVVVLIVSAISTGVILTRPTPAQPAAPRVTGTSQTASINAAAQTQNASATPQTGAARLQPAATPRTPCRSRLT